MKLLSRYEFTFAVSCLWLLMALIPPYGLTTIACIGAALGYAGLAMEERRNQRPIRPGLPVFPGNDDLEIIGDYARWRHDGTRGTYKLVHGAYGCFEAVVIGSNFTIGRRI